MDHLMPLIEALLFASDRPLSVERIKEVLEEADIRSIRAACQALRLEYDALGRAFELKEVADGFQFRTRPEFAAYVGRLKRTNPLRLSRASLEVLAIVVYRQPVLRSEIERIRGVDSGGVLKSLLERGLVRILGRENLPGRPLSYGTTRRFLEVFELKSLKDLPSAEELAQEAGVDLALASLTQAAINLIPDGDDDPAKAPLDRRPGQPTASPEPGEEEVGGEAPESSG